MATRLEPGVTIQHTNYDETLKTGTVADGILTVEDLAQDPNFPVIGYEFSTTVRYLDGTTSLVPLSLLRNINGAESSTIRQRVDTAAGAAGVTSPSNLYGPGAGFLLELYRQAYNTKNIYPETPDYIDALSQWTAGQSTARVWAVWADLQLWTMTTASGNPTTIARNVLDGRAVSLGIWMFLNVDPPLPIPPAGGG